MNYFPVFVLVVLCAEASIFYENESYYVPEWNNFLNHQYALITDLFKSYDPAVAPVYTKIDISKPIGYNPLAPKRFNYSVHLYYLKLVEVLEPQEKVSVVLEISEYWYDPRLAWNPDLYGDIKILHMRQEKVWSPTLSSFRINDLIDLRDQDFRLVCLDNTGYIFDSVSVKVSVNCPMNVNKFPFDSQTCVIQFCMPLFFVQQVDVSNSIYNGILNKTIMESMGNSEWDLINLTSRVEMLTYSDGFGNLQLATFEIKIRRNPLYYIYMIVFPSFIINALSIIGVFMKKSDKMSKLNVGLTNIMTMTFILGVMADKIPKTGSIPLLGIYIIINLFIMIISVGITIILNELRKCAIPRLRLTKNKMNQKLEYILGEPLETICMAVLEIVNAANFSVMIGMWISDS